MSRTYTLDADMCDRWLTESVRRDGSARVAPDRPMVDAIRAQQPKPRIAFKPGRVVRQRRSTQGTCYTMVEGIGAAATAGYLFVNVKAGSAYRSLTSLGHSDDGSLTLDPDIWEVVTDA